MATVRERLKSWALEEIRGEDQVNEDVLVAWYNKGLQQFQKMILEYVSGSQNTSHIFRDIDENVDEYELPLGESGIPDFYSIIQLRVAYHNDKHGRPLYRICKPMNFGDYNMRPMKNRHEDGEVKEQGGQRVQGPLVWDGVSELYPRYVFVSKNRIKIFPTPTEDIDNGLTLAYNYMTQPVKATTNEEDLNLPRYFFDAIEDYMTFRLYQAENPEMAEWYYNQFKETLNDNIYGLNKDKRPVEESFANTSYFSHNN